MPIYEYRCENGHTFEAMQSMSDAPLSSCEVCGAPVQRVLHPPAVQFKGSGFYNTDYGTRSRQREKASAEGASGGEGSAPASGAGSGDSKPAVDKSSADKPKTEKAASKS
jgi:putative FmdB family regulatory protein